MTPGSSNVWGSQRNGGATAVRLTSPHPPLLPPSISSPPHQHIPTHWHCNSQDRFSQRGTWSVSRPASRWPYAPLWFSHCCTMTNWDYCGGWALMRGHASGLQGHSCLKRIPWRSASYWCTIVRKSLLKSTQCDLAHFVWPLWYSVKASSVDTMLTHPVFPADICSYRESTTEHSVRKWHGESNIYKQ